MRFSVFPVTTGLLLSLAQSAFAGMPTPLPYDYPDRIQRLTDTALHRLQAISFFLAVFVGCGFLVRWLWNRVQRDFPAWPRLSIVGSMSLVFLWGLLFVIVLTMISGARELMTPGAWKQQGFTYKLATTELTAPTSPASGESRRREHLEQLRTALLTFAATHGGKFPAQEEMTAIASELWEVPGASPMRYFYSAGQKAGYLPEVLAYEPEIEADHRLVLKTNGDILFLRSAELQSALAKRSQP
jgi:hypothetical protein